MVVDAECEPVACDQRIRVLQLGVSLCVGGSEQLAASIGQGLDSKRFNVSFAATGIDGLIGESLREKGFTAEAFNRCDGFDSRLYRQIWSAIRRHRAQIVQSHHLSSLIYGGPPARLAGAKLVHTEHETKTYEVSPRNLRWLRVLRQLVHQFVAIDSSVADYLVEHAKVPRDRVTVIHNGIDLQRFHPGPLRDPSKDGWMIGWVGRLDPPKRPDLFVDAIGRLVASYPQLRAKIVGPGSLYHDVVRRIADAGLSERIEMLGQRADIDRILQSVDVYVLCSDAEGLPISVVEAMACGLPCIASAVGAIPTLIVHGKNGLLLNENDPAQLEALLRQILENRECALQMGVAARESALERFDLSSTVQQYSELFTRLVRQP